jgi:nitroimidazol reductase NimA-like FMN-containing flavoprotein (pyridoxamine 5'-phosphate oxidase superfamily)
VTSDETAGTVGPSEDSLPGRVADRRGELGLSVEEVAGRIGLPGPWVSRVESGATEVPGPALTRLATALETTVDDLLAPRNTPFTQRTPPPPPGQGPDPARELVKMTDEECHAHLRLHLVGRVAALDTPDPFVLPVNYVMLDRDVVLRTGVDSPLATITGPVLFEVDEIIEEARIGWSVLVRGTAEHLDHSSPSAEDATSPWPKIREEVSIRIRTRRVTGRRLRPIQSERT